MTRMEFERRRRGWTQIDLAFHSRVTNSEISRYERGQARPYPNQATRLASRGTRGRVWGKPQNGIESKYLLVGMAVCGTCGGRLHVESRSHGRRRAYHYGCT